ncbi:hypothetical protein MHU86_3887 [Fragilaria crotonensis]|nr:hypothetical protein MHU86_3887 [Fragilaria crotonensis]
MKHFHRNLQHEIDDIQATLPRSRPHDLLKAASDPTVTRMQSQFPLGTAQQHSQVSPKRLSQSPATGSALQHGTATTRKSWSHPAPLTPPTHGIPRHRRATFHENETGKVVDSIIQAQTALGPSQSSEEATRSTFERLSQQNGPYQTLEDKLHVVNAAFGVMSPQDSTANSTPTSSLASSLEERSSMVSDPPQYPTMMRRSCSQVIRSAPTTGTTATTTSQLPKSWMNETNPVLREIRAKKWQQAQEAEQKANATAKAEMRVAATDNQAPLQRQARSPRAAERDRSFVRNPNSASRSFKPAHEHHPGRLGLGSGIQESAVPFKGSPVRANSLTAMDVIRNRVLMFDSSALQQRPGNDAHAPGIPCQDFGNKAKR